MGNLVLDVVERRLEDEGVGRMAGEAESADGFAGDGCAERVAVDDDRRVPGKLHDVLENLDGVGHHSRLGRRHGAGVGVACSEVQWCKLTIIEP